MEAPLTRLLMLVIGLGIAGAIGAIMWTTWSTMATSHDFTIANPLIYDFGANRRVLVTVKNMGTVPISKIELDVNNDGTYDISLTLSNPLRQGDEYQVDKTTTTSVSYGQQVVAIRVTFTDNKVIVRLYEFPVKKS